GGWGGPCYGAAGLFARGSTWRKAGPSTIRSSTASTHSGTETILGLPVWSMRLLRFGCWATRTKRWPRAAELSRWLANWATPSVSPRRSFILFSSTSVEENRKSSKNRPMRFRHWRSSTVFHFGRRKQALWRAGPRLRRVDRGRGLFSCATGSQIFWQTEQGWTSHGGSHFWPERMGSTISRVRALRRGKKRCGVV